MASSPRSRQTLNKGGGIRPSARNPMALTLQNTACRLFWQGRIEHAHRYDTVRWLFLGRPHRCDCFAA